VTLVATAAAVLGTYLLAVRTLPASCSTTA
jgi:hypothetical protein